MTAISVWYDPDCDQIWITDEGRSYARRSLVAGSTNGNITIALKNDLDDLIINTPWASIVDVNGNGFADQATVLAYLQGEFEKRREIALTFTQPTPAASWSITHALGYCPNVSVVDTSGDLCLADVEWPDAATVLVTFGAPTAGTAYLS